MLSVSPSWRKMGIGESRGLRLRSPFISPRRFVGLQSALDPPVPSQGALIRWELDGSLTHFLGLLHLPDLSCMNTQMVTWEGLFMAQHRFQIRLLLLISGWT